MKRIKMGSNSRNKKQFGEKNSTTTTTVDLLPPLLQRLNSSFIILLNSYLLLQGVAKRCAFGRRPQQGVAVSSLCQMCGKLLTTSKLEANRPNDSTKKLSQHKESQSSASTQQITHDIKIEDDLENGGHLSATVSVPSKQTSTEWLERSGGWLPLDELLRLITVLPAKMSLHWELSSIHYDSSLDPFQRAASMTGTSKETKMTVLVGGKEEEIEIESTTGFRLSLSIYGNEQMKLKNNSRLTKRLLKPLEKQFLQALINLCKCNEEKILTLRAPISLCPIPAAPDGSVEAFDEFVCPSSESMSRNIKRQTSDTIDTDQIIENLIKQPWYHNQIVSTHRVPECTAKCRLLHCQLSDPLIKLLCNHFKGNPLTKKLFFDHQSICIESLVNRNEDVVLCTSTSSGKSIVFHTAVLESILKNHRSTALLLYPTKALAQDQLRALSSLISTLESTARCESCRDHGMSTCPMISIHTYDGDTNFSDREVARLNSNILLVNPDILHISILPNSNKFRRILSNLKFIVLDEGHVYRGVFGAHTAWIIRRLLRLCQTVYNSTPQVVYCSATISNPLRHFQLLTGRGSELSRYCQPSSVSELSQTNVVVERQNPDQANQSAGGFFREQKSSFPLIKSPPAVCVVTSDGSPAGDKTFIMWNPPTIIELLEKRELKGSEMTEVFKTPHHDLPFSTSAISGRSTSKQDTLRLNESSSSSLTALDVDTEEAFSSKQQLATTDLCQQNAPPQHASRSHKKRSQSGEVPSECKRRKDSNFCPQLNNSQMSPNCHLISRPLDDLTTSQPEMLEEVYKALNVSTAERPKKSAFTEIAILVAYLVSAPAIVVMEHMIRIGCSRGYLKSWKLDHLLPKLVSYRGGYTARDRRELEKKIFNGEVYGVVCTNALELGIDIGTLDATLILGYPGSITAMKQQFGRAGRGIRRSLSIMIAFDSPLDQYCIHHGNYLLSKDPEAVCVDPTNAQVFAQHLVCSASEHSPISLTEIVHMWGIDFKGKETNQKMNTSNEVPMDSIRNILFDIEQSGTLSRVSTCPMSWKFTNALVQNGRLVFAPMSGAELQSSLLYNEEKANRGHNVMKDGFNESIESLGEGIYQRIEEVVHEPMPPKDWTEMVSVAANEEGQTAQAHSSQIIIPTYLYSQPHKFVSIRAIESRRVRVALLPSGEIERFYKSVVAPVELNQMTSRAVEVPETTNLLEKGLSPSGFFRSKDDEMLGGMKVSLGLGFQKNKKSLFQILDDIELGMALFFVFPGAIYLNRGREYFVDDLDLHNLIARVVPVKPRYFTRCRDRTDVEVLSILQTNFHGNGCCAKSANTNLDDKLNDIEVKGKHLFDLSSWRVSCGKVQVITQVMGFYKIDKRTHHLFERVDGLHIPPFKMTTEGVWLEIDHEFQSQLQSQKYDVRGSLHGLAHAFVASMALLVLCDPEDLCTECPNKNDTVFRPMRVMLFDSRPGGIGLSTTLFPKIESLLQICLDRIKACDCPSGCIQCVCSARCSELNEVMDKNGTKALCHLLLEDMMKERMTPIQ